MHLIVVIQSDSVLMSLLSSVEYVFLPSQSLQAQAFCSVLLLFKIGTETLGIGWGGDCFKKYLLVVKVVQYHIEFKSGWSQPRWCQCLCLCFSSWRPCCMAGKRVGSRIDAHLGSFLADFLGARDLTFWGSSFLSHQMGVIILSTSYLF